MKLLVVALGLVFSALTVPAWAITPKNDDFAKAAVIPSANRISVGGTTLDATFEAVDRTEIPGDLFLLVGNRSVWYKWIPPLTASTVFDCQASFDSTMALYRQNGSTLVGITEDDDSGDGLNSQITTSVQAGNTYFIRVDRFLTGNVNGGRFTLVLTQAGTISDTFGSEPIFRSGSFTAVGSNSGYTVETGEPRHGDLLRVGNSSAWVTWVAPFRATVTADTVGSRFDTVLAVYTGEEVTNLRRIAQDDNSIRPNLSRVRFSAQAGVTYHFAVDGNRTSGTFNLNVVSQKQAPLVQVNPKDVIVLNGAPFTLTSTSLVSGVPLFQWQRKLAGETVWTDLSDVNGAPFSGSINPVLTVNTTTFGDNNSEYRLKVTDDVGTSFGASIKVTITEFPAQNLDVLGRFEYDLIPDEGSLVPLPSNGGSYFVKGLPLGLTFDPVTGVISGLISSKVRPGVYRVTYGSTASANGKVLNPQQYVIVLNVGPFSPQIAGGFEALLEAAAAPRVPLAKLALKIDAKGNYTGTLRTLSDDKVYSLKGVLAYTVTSAPRTAAPFVHINLKRSRPLSPLNLRFTLTEPSLPETESSVSILSAQLFTGEQPRPPAAPVELPLLAEADGTGRQLLIFSKTVLAPWAADYTALFRSPVGLETVAVRPTPEGSGYALGKIASDTGALAFKGRLADGTEFTSSTPPVAGTQYFVAQRVYKNAAGGSLAGTIKLDRISVGTPAVPAFVYRSNVDTGSELFWVRPAIPKSTSYLPGFGPISVNVVMSPWVVPDRNLSSKFGAAGDLLDRQGRLNTLLNILGRDVDNSGTNVRNLPVNFKITSLGEFTNTDLDRESATDGFRITLKSDTGEFEGTYTIRDQPLPPSLIPPPARAATFRGVLLQNESLGTGDLIGGGYFLIETPSNVVPKTNFSGKIEFVLGIRDNPI